MDKRILSHFRKNDPRIFSLAERISLDLLVPKRPDQFFASLVSSIIGQQLSNSVADVIEARFVRLIAGPVTPEAVIQMKDDALRSTGISWSKIRYIKDLSERVRSESVDLSGLAGRSDAAVIEELTKVKGIGPWTAEMFLIFTLAREDVFSFGDLGLKRGIRGLYGLKNDPSVSYMKRLTARWSPYRSYAARLLWRYKDSA